MTRGSQAVRWAAPETGLRPVRPFGKRDRGGIQGYGLGACASRGNLGRGPRRAAVFCLIAGFRSRVRSVQVAPQSGLGPGEPSEIPLVIPPNFVEAAAHGPDCGPALATCQSQPGLNFGVKRQWVRGAAIVHLLLTCCRGHIFIGGQATRSSVA